MFADLPEARQGNQGPLPALCGPEEILRTQRKIFEYIKYLQSDIIEKVIAGLIQSKGDVLIQEKKSGQFMREAASRL